MKENDKEEGDYHCSPDGCTGIGNEEEWAACERMHQERKGWMVRLRDRWMEVERGGVEGECFSGST